MNAVIRKILIYIQAGDIYMTWNGDFYYDYHNFILFFYLLSYNTSN